MANPSNSVELRNFLGLASYYRHFITNFADIAVLLYQLQEEGIHFQWSEQCRTAFDTVEKKLSSALVLAFLSPRGTWTLSEYGSGAGLSLIQNG